MGAAALVPELYVRSLPESLSFYCDVLGFEIKFERPEECFAYLRRGGAELMLEEPIGRVWLAGPLEPPMAAGSTSRFRPITLRRSTNPVLKRARGSCVIWKKGSISRRSIRFWFGSSSCKTQMGISSGFQNDCKTAPEKNESRIRQRT